jgi:hypothetical protein
MYFEASKEATKIETMAKERIDTDDSKSKTVSRELTEEWMSLSPKERNLVAQALEDKYQNNSFDALPIPSVERDGVGQCTSITFCASDLDMNHGPHEIQLKSFSPSGGGKEVDLLSSTGGDSDLHTLDWVAYEAPASALQQGNLASRAAQQDTATPAPFAPDSQPRATGGGDRTTGAGSDHGAEPLPSPGSDRDPESDRGAGGATAQAPHGDPHADTHHSTKKATHADAPPLAATAPPPEVPRTDVPPVAPKHAHEDTHTARAARAGQAGHADGATPKAQTPAHKDTQHTAAAAAAAAIADTPSATFQKPVPANMVY